MTWDSLDIRWEPDVVRCNGEPARPAYAAGRGRLKKEMTD